MTVEVAWQTDDRPLDDAAVVAAVRSALVHGGRPGIEIGVVLVGDDELRELHERWLGDPTRTDVITFDLGEGDGPEGEIWVSVECARRLAPDRGVPVERELALYLVHGALHLCGYDDHDEVDRARMRAAERDVLAELGYPPDEGPSW